MVVQSLTQQEHEDPLVFFSLLLLLLPSSEEIKKRSTILHTKEKVGKLHLDLSTERIATLHVEGRRGWQARYDKITIGYIRGGGCPTTHIQSSQCYIVGTRAPIFVFFFLFNFSLGVLVMHRVYRKWVVVPHCFEACGERKKIGTVP